ncbi:TasA family protein [Neobacillus sp. SCS-31]|uniref:TasA family protein n=1 Tax=Neobacillus oceani TaxID=3115292 RepID=UPI003905C541
MGIKKQLAGTVLAAGIGIAAISGGTFALFTANATNTGNTIATGTVSLVDDTGGSVFKSISVNNIAPGDTGTGSITVRNDGTLDEWVKIESVTGSGPLFTGANKATVTGSADVVKLEPGQSKTFSITYSLPLAAGNEYQGVNGTVDVKVQSVQAKNNTNGSGNGPSSWN